MSPARTATPTISGFIFLFEWRKTSGLPITASSGLCHDTMPPKPSFLNHCMWTLACVPFGMPAPSLSVTVTSNGPPGVQTSGASTVHQSSSVVFAGAASAAAAKSAAARGRNAAVCMACLLVLPVDRGNGGAASVPAAGRGFVIGGS